MWTTAVIRCCRWRRTDDETEPCAVEHRPLLECGCSYNPRLQPSTDHVQIMWPRYRSVVIHQCSSRTGSNGRCIDRILWVWFLRLVEVKPFWRSLKKHFHWLKIHTSHFLQLSGWGVYWNLSERCLNYNLKKWSTLFKELMIEKRKYISRRYTQM